MHDHPCLHCTLPDCDEASPRCALRVAYNRAQSRSERGMALTEREMLARQELQTHYLLERRIRAQDAQRAEGDAR